MQDLQIDVKDRVVIVTGGSQGIGRSIVQAFVSSGAKVLVADMAAPADLDQAAGFLEGNSIFVETDITLNSSVTAMVEQALNVYGKIDILVNNAGIIYKADIENIEIESWQRLLDVNLTGAVSCTKAVVPEMKKQMWGRIINMSSMQAFMGSPTYSAYTASKAALSGLTRVWAAELAPFQVTVNAICPSFVETPMMAASIARLAREKSISTEDARAHFTAPIPQKRILQPEEIAFSALFLSSPLAQGVTGHDLVVAAGCAMH
jgi:3-hydroxybutyrate dehydrogenase